MTRPSMTISHLTKLVEQGDESAAVELLARYRERLKRMIAVYIDGRLLSRFNASDVVQETFIEAHQKLRAYLIEQPIAFYPWLRQIAWEKLIQLRRHHWESQKRSVQRERHGWGAFSDESIVVLADRMSHPQVTPSEELLRTELRYRVRTALARLSLRDREVLILRYVEQLSTAEAADVLGISQATFLKRHVRALRRLRTRLDESSEEWL